jgi:adenine-specific DNA-methyltransferase
MNFNDIYIEYDKLTKKFFENKSIKDVKDKSQYFTPTREVNKLLEDLIILNKDEISILEPSCGNGILAIKLIEKVFLQYTPKTINIIFVDKDYEISQNIHYLMGKLKKVMSKTVLDYTVICDDFLRIEFDFKFDYIIMNPPYKKIRMHDVPTDLKEYVKGQPNLYHLFISKTLNLIKKKGTLSIISPKNYLSGKYTELLRHYIFSQYSIHKIHTLNNRTSVFDFKIIQEICMVQIIKNSQTKLNISYNGFNKFNCDINTLILNDTTKIVLTPRHERDYMLISKFSKFNIGVVGKDILLKTGKVVQFRIINKLSNLTKINYNKIKKGAPLIVSRHISKNKLYYNNIDKRNASAITLLDNGENDNVLINNQNMVLIRKATDKKNDKLIESTTYFKNLDYNKIAIDNSVAYFTNESSSLTEIECKGINCILMSEQFDAYYRMINSTNTLNVYEFENMHFPDIKTIRKIGSKVKSRSISIKDASFIMSEFL